MAATLERNGRDGKFSPSNIPAREVVRCSKDGCECSYTLSYTDEEHFVSGSKLNTEKMRWVAIDLIENEHPSHFTKVFLWKGPERGWFEADSLAAREVL